MEKNQSFNLYALSNFMKDLELHAQHTKCFFDTAFMQIVHNYFRFNDMSLVVYDNFKYVTSIPFNRPTYLQQAYSEMGYEKKDAFARYVSEHFDDLAMGGHTTVLRSSDALSAFPMSQIEYRKFLNYAGLEYAAVLPINKRFRLTAFKDASCGNFTEQEIERLSILLHIIRFRYQSFLEQQRRNAVSQAKSSLLDNLRIGYIILDENFHVLDYNPRVLQYIEELFYTSQVANAISLLLERLSSSAQTIYKNYGLALNTYTEIDYFGTLRRYNSITISGREAVWAQTAGKSLPFHLLTTRELEVLDYFSKGFEYSEIAERLFISEGTIKTHMKNIYRKLGIDNQRKLVHEYVFFLAFSAPYA